MLRQRQLLHTHYYTHTYLVRQGNLKLYQLFPPCKPYLPKSSDKFVEFRPVCRGGGVRRNPPFWLSSGFQNMQAHNKKSILTSVRHKLCSTMGNKVCFFISGLHVHTGKVAVDKLPFYNPAYIQAWSCN